MSKRRAFEHDLQEERETVIVYIIACTEYMPVLLRGNLFFSEYQELKRMAGTRPTERQDEVLKKTAAGEVLRKVYKYKGSYEEWYTLGDNFETTCEADMADHRGYTLVWYLTE